jgi:FtsP/CotA-like multicopper oxidase with cupredoxin domain
MNMKNEISKKHLLLALMVAITLFLTPAAFAAVPGITGPNFNLTAQPAYLNQPDGAAVYSWGYGCNGAPAGFLPAAVVGATCPTMQVPGPTLIVTEGTTVTVTLTNNLPPAAGNTSILFPGFQVCIGTISAGVCTPSAPGANGVTGLLTQEAVPGGTVSYSFVASQAGTHAYYSGTQGDLQIELGLYGAVVVLPSAPPASCGQGVGSASATTGNLHDANVAVKQFWKEPDFRLSTAAYDHPGSCYDREYLFQWAEMDSRIHRQAEAQVAVAAAACTAGITTSNPTGAGAPGCSLDVQTEPYHPGYFIINGRSMPDLMDPNYAAEYPHQPYNGNPHTHPGELLLIRTIGQGRWQHPFHEHANHVRILARDANMILSPTNPAANLAGILMFNTDTTPGQAFDGIFYFTGRGLNWDPYGHLSGADVNGAPSDPLAHLPCYPDSNGYYTVNSTPPAPVSTVNYYEWCQDHNKPLQVNPFGDVNSGGPATLPDPDILTNGAWYGGTPYLGPDASLRGGNAACATGNTSNPANCTPLNPANTQANPANERGWAFMWHSHNEREITTNNVFPGGMLMMLLVDSREFVIDESL